MKKTLLLSLFICLFVKGYAQTVEPQLFPEVEGKVMYEKVVPVEGLSQGQIYLKAFNWIIDTFKERNKISESFDDAQSVYRIRTYVDIYTVDFTIQIDSKDNKYRYRIFDIKRTVTGKDESSLFSKYLVNVPAENINNIVKGEVKGYSKGQKKEAQASIILIDDQLNRVTNSLQKAVAPKKVDNF